MVPNPRNREPDSRGKPKAELDDIAESTVGQQNRAGFQIDFLEHIVAELPKKNVHFFPLVWNEKADAVGSAIDVG